MDDNTVDGIEPVLEESNQNTVEKEPINNAETAAPLEVTPANDPIPTDNNKNENEGGETSAIK